MTQGVSTAPAERGTLSLVNTVPESSESDCDLVESVAESGIPGPRFEGPVLGREYPEGHFRSPYLTVPAPEPSVLLPEEVRRLEDRFGDASMGSQIKEYGRDAIAVLGEILLNPREKSTVRLDAAKWFLEKISGKASQQIQVESQTLSHFMDLLRTQAQVLRLTNGHGPEGQALDVSPGVSPGTAGAQREQTEDSRSTVQKWFDENG